MSYTKEVYYTHSVGQTQALGEALAAELVPGSFVALFGGMGMGKTAFVTGLVRGLGLDAQVSSPTFAIVNEYMGDPSLLHFDMYRIESWDDLYSTGFFDYLDGRHIIACEWSENIAAALPDDALIVTIEPGEDESSRKITVEKGSLQ